jgi:hypothetical protein
MQTPFDPDLPLHPINEVCLLGVRHEPGRPGDGLPRWMHGVTAVAVEGKQYIHDLIERLSPAPYLDLFGTECFSEHWTVAAP